jgi:undecaprenyl diphosphate synthase
MALEDILPQVEARMRKAIDALKHELASVRTGRAAPSLVEELEVDAYGAATPLVSLAAISAPEPRQIVIQPWDRSLIKAIEKAILASDLGLTPGNDGAVIRLNIPALNEERRRELVKQLHKKVEEGRVEIRTLRRDDRRGEARRDPAPEAHRPVHPHRRRGRTGEGKGDPLRLTPAVPRHLAIVMDGNRRWARKKHLPAIAGHRAGVDTIRRTLRAARERGVEYLTLYSFSTENWSRDEEEVGALMALLEETIRRETKTLVEDGVRLMVIGRLHELSDRLQRAIAGAVKETSPGTRGVMTLAFNYGGRAEIVDAVKRLVAEGVPPDEIDEAAIAKRLYAPEHPDPDLLIRTGGELRVSNFLLWEVAYSEMWATQALWPDFSVADLDAALESYAKRERRFGR